MVTETGRIIEGASQGVLRAIKSLGAPHPHSYKEVAEDFTDNARTEWYGNSWRTANPHPFGLRPYEINFDPAYLYITGTSAVEIQRMVSGQLFRAIKRWLPPEYPDYAYTYQILHPKSGALTTVSYYLSEERAADPANADMVHRVTGGFGRYGVGLLIDEARDKHQIALFPPGYNPWEGYTRERASADETLLFSSKGEFPKPLGAVDPIEADEIGIDLPADIDPKRRFFRKFVGEESYWSAASK